MNKKQFALFLVIICTILNTAAQFFIKSGSVNFSFDFLIFTNINLIIGGILYASSLVAYLYALKYLELSSLAPLLSVQYIIVAFISFYFYNEPIGYWQIFGLFFIILGVIFIAKGAKA